MDLLIEARGLSVRHGHRTALERIDLAVAPGRIVGLVGHNGAGKTSLLKALVGLLPVEGNLQVLGLHPHRQRVRLLESLCYIPDVAILPRWARVEQLIALMTGLQPRFSAERARELLRRTSVGLSQPVDRLSKGMVAQVHLALVAAVDARLMLLDEPTLGLDMPSRQAFYAMLAGEWCDGRRSVVVATHELEQIEPVATDVVILNEGRVTLSTPLSQEPHASGTTRKRPTLAELFAALTRSPEVLPLGG